MFQLLLSLLLLTLSQAVMPTDIWKGSFTTTNWFSDIRICSSVSSTTGTYYIQGLANKVAYLRGNSTCAPGSTYPCKWDGRVYYNGRDAVKGSFSFEINSAAGDFTGVLSLDGGLEIKNFAIVGGSRTSATQVTEMECFESDVGYIESRQPQFSGAGKSVINPTYYKYQQRSLVGSNMLFSYAYYYKDGLADGQLYGTCFEDRQVCTNTWYQSENSQGIEFWVGKNSTHTYSSWSIAPTLSEHNTKRNYTGDDGGVDLTVQIAGTELAAAETSTVNFCLSLPTAKDELACSTSTSVSHPTCTCTTETSHKQLIEVAVAFSILTFVISTAVALKVFVFTVKSGPMASSSIA